MALLGIDELNTPKVEVEEPKKYFSKMAISKEQKEERVDTANDIMDVLLFFFALLAIEMQENNPDYDMVLEKFRVRFGEAVAAHSRMDDHQNAYVDEFTQNQFDITRRHMEAVGVGVDGQMDAGWWSSPDRAMSIGEDAANTILNYEELKQAAEAGAVGKKWVDRDDGKVRPTHNEVPKKIIPLAEYFVVGDGIMQYPCDWDNNPKECYRCRCSCHYYDKDGKVVKIVAHYNGHVINNKVNPNSASKENKTYDTNFKPSELRNARFASGQMSMEELARAKELWYSYDEVEGLTPAEKEHVYEELDNNLTAEEKSMCLVRKAIDDYWYRAINMGHNQYKIIGKEPVDPYDDWLDEILSEVIGRNWKNYDI